MAILAAADGLDHVEPAVPRKALEAAGAVTEVVSLRRGKIRQMNLLVPGKRVCVDRMSSDIGD